MNRDARRVALVTGCGKPLGIGGASARALSAAGMAVVVTDMAPTGARNPQELPSDVGADWDGLAGLVREVQEAGGEASAAVGDVSVEADARRMVADTLARHGRLDVLVNNAAAPQEPMVDIDQVTLEDWERLMAVNLRGAFLMCRAAVPAMRRNGWGRIVNISSVHGKRGRARRLAYSASKAGLLAFTQALALEVADAGITVNAVCPGRILTTRSLSSARRDGEDAAAVLERREQAVPVGRFGSGADVAAAVAFLASDASSFVTGQAWDIDGGTLLTIHRSDS